MCDTQDVTNAHLISCRTLALISLTAPLLRTAAEKQQKTELWQGRQDDGERKVNVDERGEQHDRGKKKKKEI